MRKKCSKEILEGTGYCFEEISVFKVWHKACVTQTCIAACCCSFLKYIENLVLRPSKIFNGKCFFLSNYCVLGKW